MRNRQLSKDYDQKNWGQWFLILIFLFLCAFPRLQAQDAGSAIINATTKVITLDTNVDFNYHYAVDISSAGFESQAAAVAFFEDVSNKMVSFEMRSEEEIVDIYLNTRAKSDWETAEWNTYLASLFKKEN